MHYDLGSCFCLFFVPSSTKTCQNQVSFSCTRFKIGRKRWFSTECVVNLWKAFPQDVLDAESICEPKRKLDKFVNEKLIIHY